MCKNSSSDNSNDSYLADAANSSRGTARRNECDFNGANNRQKIKDIMLPRTELDRNKQNISLSRRTNIEQCITVLLRSVEAVTPSNNLLK